MGQNVDPSLVNLKTNSLMEWAYYNQLPKEIREIVASAPFDYSTELVYSMWTSFKKDLLRIDRSPAAFAAYLDEVMRMETVKLSLSKAEWEGEYRLENLHGPEHRRTKPVHGRRRGQNIISSFGAAAKRVLKM